MAVDSLVEDMAVELPQQQTVLWVQMVVDRVILLVVDRQHLLVVDREPLLELDREHLLVEDRELLLVVDREILLEMVDIQDKEEDPQKYYSQDKDN